MGYRGGGVGIYTKKCIKSVMLQQLSVFHDRVYETLIIEITTSNKCKFVVGSIYRPNNHPILTTNEQFDIFSELLTNTLDSINEIGIPSFIFGDFNLNVLEYGICSKGTAYIDLLYSHGFLQTIIYPTRCAKNSATVIDHCITNNSSMCHKSTILTTLISDHFPILYTITKNKQSYRPKFIETRNFLDSNIQNFKTNIKSINWEPLIHNNDVQSSYDYFSETFISLYELYFPLTKKRFNPKYHRADPWFTNGLLISRREKIRLDGVAARTGRDDDAIKYKRYRNTYNKLVKLAKKLYFDNKIQTNQGNLKQTWKILRSAINKKDKKSNNSISSILHNNQTVTCPETIANILNEYFCSEPTNIVNGISPFPKEGGADPESLTNGGGAGIPSFRSADLQVGSEEIYAALSSLETKNSLDADNLSMQFIKKCFDTIITPFQHIVNLSLSSGIIPSQFKIAKVIPIFKSGDPRLPNNYRPISLLSNFSKILEKIMYNRLINFIEHHNLLSKHQFGFRKNHSTIHPMVLLDNYISEALNNKNYAIAIYCDLRKAFDTVDHSILISKLRKMGIGGTELKWFVNYLTDRKQFVHIDGKCSSLLNILLGVPQGSILGPLLF